MNTRSESKGPSRLIEDVSKAIWEAERQNEIKRIWDFEFDHDLFVRAATILRDAGRRETALLGFSLMSECLDAGLRYHLSYSTARDRKELLDGLGPLSSDAARLRLVRLLGWLPDIISDGVEAFRRIRNTVAHQIKGDHEIDIVSELPPSTRAMMDAAIGRLIEVMGKHTEDTPEWTELTGPKAYALILSSQTLESLVCGPGRLRLGIGRKHEPIYSFEEAPPWAVAAHESFAKSVLLIARISIDT